MKILTCGSSAPSGSQNAWTRIRNVNGASRLSNVWNFFGAIQMISCRDGWPWTKPGYITVTWRQSNNQWSGGIAAHPAPKNSVCWKISCLNILGSRRHPLIDHLPKGQTINVEYYSSLLVQMKDFWAKNAAGSSPRASCSCTTMPRLTGHFQPRRNWPPWASSILITHHILRIRLRWFTTCSLDWRKQLKVRHFSSDVEVIAAAETWLEGQSSEFFWVACIS